MMKMKVFMFSAILMSSPLWADSDGGTPNPIPDNPGPSDPAPGPTPDGGIHITANPSAAASAWMQQSQSATATGTSTASSSIGGVNVSTTNEAHDIPWYGWGSGPGVGSTNTSAIGRNAFSHALPLIGGGTSGTKKDRFTRALAAAAYGRATQNRKIVATADQVIQAEIEEDLTELQKPAKKQATKSTSVAPVPTATSAEVGPFGY